MTERHWPTLLVDFAPRSTLVTGAVRGIGRATALRLAAAAWEVVAGLRRAEDGDAVSQGQPGLVGGGARAQAALALITPTPMLDTMLRIGTGVPRRP